MKVEVGERRTTVDPALVMEYGIPITDVARAVRENVISAVERVLGAPGRVTVHRTARLGGY